jgi:SAM-dependent methyltransferase
MQETRRLGTPLVNEKGRSLHQLLRELYRGQLALDPHSGYLIEHGRPICIENQIRTFDWYRPHLPTGGKVLDWGCNHAPDSCLLRATYADDLDLHSCDFTSRETFRVFHDFARTSHVLLDDPFRLPYASNSFDAVIGSGVLEHTALDYESLKELYRILKPGGVVVISYLPNWLSAGEWVRRVVRRRDFHLRLYGMTEARQLLKRSGFYPISEGYHTYFWERKLASVGLSRWERGLTRLLKCAVPIQVFSSTLCFIARKMNVM